MRWVHLDTKSQYSVRVALDPGALMRGPRWCGEARIKGEVEASASALTTISHNELIAWARFWGADENHPGTKKALANIAGDIDPAD